MNKLSKEYLKMQSYYVSYQAFFKKNILTLLGKLEMDLVVYDETEYFREYDDAQFDYPYTLRKTKLGAQFFTVANTDVDYQFNKADIKFMKSETCLEAPIID